MQILNAAPLAEMEMVDTPLTRFPSGPNNSLWARTTWSSTGIVKETLASNLFLGTITLRIREAICGTFVTGADLDSVWGFSNSTSRAFQTTRTRFASFLRMDGAWYLDRVAPLAIAAPNGASVSISAVRLYPASNLTVPMLTLSNDSLSNLMATNSLPRVDNFQWIRVEVDATGAAANVFAHHNGTRSPLFDDGSNGDRVAGDHTYSTSIYIGGATWKHLQFDAIDRTSITDPATPVVATVWDVLLTARYATDVYE
ncbi:MAG: hypothetical protein J0L75_13365 [Spirochaetes bacterium]|nr:hypothetical protein [Spirochaetota bacterium]